jgi:putative tricarboxylic transport membrane protein
MSDAPRHDPLRPGGAAPRLRRFDGASLVVAAVLAVLAIVLFRDAARLPQEGGYAGMGPADTPRLVALGLALLAVWTAWEAFRAPAEPAPHQNVPPILWIVGGLGLQLVLLTSAGFSVAGGVLFACTAAAFGRRKLWITVPVGILFALVIFGIFALLLELSLPPGPLERLIFGI